MKINLLLVILSITLLYSCDCENSRECQEFYYDTDLWQTIDEDDKIVFTSNEGEDLIFSLKETVSNQPYVESRRSGCPGGQDVGCRLTRYYIYSLENSSVEINLNLEQIEAFNQPLEEQQVFYCFSIRENLEDEFVKLHSFQIEPNYSTDNSNGLVLDSIELNNKIYYDVIQSQIDSSFYQINNDVYFWNITASRGEGVISLLAKDGVEYFLSE